MILTGPAIEHNVDNGFIKIEPFDKSKVNPNSYNLTLHDEYGVYMNKVLDMKDKNDLLISKIPESGLILYPGELYLMRTVEKIKTDFYVPIVDGRSSAGRLGISVHQTAGFCDVGFSGYITLEVTVVKPTKIYPFTEICQLRFEKPEGEIKLYKGKYHNNEGIQGSMIFKELN